MTPLQDFVKRERLVLSLLFILGFIFYLFVLTEHSLIYGVDGPYYLVQVESLLEKGQLAYNDSPFVFYLLAFFSFLAGGDATLGIKIVIALFSALSAIPLYFWVKKALHSNVAGYVAVIALVFSASFLRLMSDFLKNAVGIFFLLCFLYYLHSLATEKENKRNLFFAVFFLALTGLMHKLDFGVAMLFTMVYLIIGFFFAVNKSIAKNIGALVLAIIALGLAALLVFPSIFSSQFFSGLSYLQALFAGESQGIALKLLFDPLVGILVLPILAIGILLSFFEWRNKNKEAALAVSAATIAGLALSFPFIMEQLLFRSLLMEFIPMALILGYCATKLEEKSIVPVLIPLVLFLLIAQAIVMSSVIGPTISETDYNELRYIAKFVPSKAVVVSQVPHGYWYWVLYTSKSNITKDYSRELWQDYEHVLLLAFKQEKSAASQAPGSAGVSQPLGNPPPVLSLPSAASQIPANLTKIVESQHFILFEAKNT